jgi:iron complex transport system substrate-binding protein
MSPRIVSFLPAATEMAYALGLGESIVGVSHECDHPPEARRKPTVVRSAIDVAHLTPGEIDVAVSARSKSGASMYQVDESLLRALTPDLILTQDLCQVCAPSGNDVTRVVDSLDPRPEVLYFTPRSLADVNDNLRMLGAASGVGRTAEELVRRREERLGALAARTSAATHRPRVFFAEWADPVYCGGHWVAEMVHLAGGHDALAKRGVDSVRIAWDDVLTWAPEILIIAPCGFAVGDAASQVELLRARPGWHDIPAVRSGRVFAVDANAYFARPGPRLIEGVELLAHLIHPELEFQAECYSNRFVRCSQ